MAEHTEDWHRAGRLVAARRAALGLTQQEVQAAGGPSVATQRNIENAKQDAYQDTVLGRLERALQWEPGSFETILNGGEPRPLPLPTSSAASATALAADASVRTLTSDPAIRLIEEARRDKPIEELAARASLRPEQWRSIASGVTPAGPQELARMARAVGVESFELRNAGRADVADAVQELDMEEQFAGQTTEEILVETGEVTEALIELMKKKGLDLSSLQMRDVEAWAKLFATGLNEMRRRNNAS